MGLLQAAPSERIRTLPELVAIAHAMETEAAERYAGLADHMRGIGNPATADVLDALSAEERGHVDAVARLSQARIGRAPDLADVAWEGWAAVFDVEDLAESRLVTPYRALSIAVRNEERAFAFWSYMSANSDDPTIRREAERLAQEELGHVAKLRKERRRAFHHARTPPPSPSDPAGFPPAALATARALQALSEDLAARFETAGHPAARTLRTLAGEQATAAHTLAEGGAAASEPTPAAPAGPPADASFEALVSFAIERFEAAVEDCFRAAEEMGDENTVRLAQAIAEPRIRHLAALREWDLETSSARAQARPRP